MVDQLIRGGRLACPDFTEAMPGNPPAAQVFGAKDATSGGAIRLSGGGERYMVVAGTHNSGGDSVYNEGAYTDDFGQTFTRFVAPFSRRNEIPYAQCNDDRWVATPRIFMIGGKSAVSNVEQDAYYFDENGWHTITGQMEGYIAGQMGYFNKAYFCEETGLLYCMAGEAGDGSVIVSGGGLSGEDYCRVWQKIGNVPQSFVGVGRYAFTKFKGHFYLAGLQDIGELWRTTDFQEWELVLSNADIFGFLWPDMAAGTDFMVYQRGGINRSGPVPTNGWPNNPIGWPGTFWSADGSNWHQIKGVQYPGQHAGTMYSSPTGNAIIQTGGNMHTQFSRYRDILKTPD